MDLKNILLPLGITAVAYYAVKNIFGIGPDKEERQTTEAVEEIRKIEESAGAKPTYLEQQYQIFADQFYQGVRFSAVSDDYDSAENVLMQMKNTLDVVMLIQAFGTRQEWWFGPIPDGPKKTLPEFVRDDFWQSRINRVNNYFERSGINVRF